MTTHPGIVLAMVATVVYNLGFIVEKRALGRLPALEAHHVPRLARTLFTAPAWLAGFLLICGGLVLQLLVLSLEPLTVAQPLQVSGVVVTILFARHTVELHRIVIAESRRFPALGRLFYKSGPEACIAMLAAYLERHSSRETLNLRNPRRTAEEFLELLRGYAHLRVLLGVQKTLSARELEENIEGAVQHILRAR